MPFLPPTSYKTKQQQEAEKQRKAAEARAQRDAQRKLQLKRNAERFEQSVQPLVEGVRRRTMALTNKTLDTIHDQAKARITGIGVREDERFKRNQEFESGTSKWTTKINDQLEQLRKLQASGGAEPQPSVPPVPDIDALRREAEAKISGGGFGNIVSSAANVAEGVSDRLDRFATNATEGVGHILTPPRVVGQPDTQVRYGDRDTPQVLQSQTTGLGEVTTPTVTEEEVLNALAPLPLPQSVKEETARQVSFLSSPAGVAGVGVDIATAGAGSAALQAGGSFALGALGREAELQGIDPRLKVGPLDIGLRAAGEALGPAVGPMVGPRIGRGLGAAGDAATQYGRNVAANAPDTLPAAARAGLDPFEAGPPTPVAAGMATGGMPPRAPLSAVDLEADFRNFDVALHAPPNEKISQTVTRRLVGETRDLGDRARQIRSEIQREADAAGINFDTDGRGIINALETNSVNSLPPNQQGVATRLREILDAEEKAMITADPSFRESALEDYFPHLFKKAEKPRAPVGSGVNPRFKMQRTQEGTIEDVLSRRADLDLVTNNPIDLTYMRVAEGIKYRAGTRLLDRLKAAGMAQTVETAPADWRVPNAPLFQGKTAQWIDEAGKPRMRKIQYATPPEVADFMDDFFGRSAFTTNTAGRVVKAGVQSLKMLKVFGGLFQHFDYTLRQLGTGVGEAIPGTAKGRFGRIRFQPKSVSATGRAWARGFVPQVDAAMTKFDLSDPVRSALIRNGIQMDGGLDIMEREFGDLLKEPGFLARAGVTSGKAVKRVKGAIDYISSGAYLKAHKEHILSHGERLTQQYLAEGMNIEQAAARAAREANEHFSSIPNWQSVFRSPTTRDAMRTIFFSHNEAEAWTKNFFRAFTGPNRASAVRFYGGILGTTVAMANLFNVIATGKPLPMDRYNPVSNRDSKIGLPFTYNTTFLRPNAPWKGPLGQETYIDILGQADTPIRWALDPVFGTTSRLGQIPRVAMDLVPAMSGQQVRDFSGKPVEGVEGFANYAFEQVVPLPGQGVLSEKGRIGPEGAGVQAAGINISAEPLRDLLARRYEEITGEKYNPDTGWQEASTIPELKPILDEIERRQLAYQVPSAVKREEREAFLAELEQESQIPQFARAVEKNLPGAGVAFRDAFSDLQTAASIAAARDFFGRDPKEVESPEGQAFRDYVDLTPESYRDPNTFEINWGKYFDDKEAAKQALPPRLRDYLDSQVRTVSPEGNRVEPRYKAARDVYGEYNDIPKYKGLSVEESDEVDEITRMVMYTRLRSGTPEDMTSWDAFQEVSGQFSPKIARWYEDNLLTRPSRRKGGLGGGFGTRHTPKKPNPQDPRRDEMLLDNPDIIYFGFVNTSQLPLEMRSQLPDYILSGGLPSTESPVLAGTATGQ